MADPGFEVLASTAHPRLLDAPHPCANVKVSLLQDYRLHLHPLSDKAGSEKRRFDTQSEVCYLLKNRSLYVIDEYVYSCGSCSSPLCFSELSRVGSIGNGRPSPVGSAGSNADQQPSPTPAGSLFPGRFRPCGPQFPLKVNPQTKEQPATLETTPIDHENPKGSAHRGLHGFTVPGNRRGSIGSLSALEGRSRYAI